MTKVEGFFIFYFFLQACSEHLKYKHFLYFNLGINAGKP